MQVEPIISLHDHKGRVIWANYAPGGIPLEELVGSYPWDWVDDPDKHEARSRFALCIALAEPQKFTVFGMVNKQRVQINCRIDPTTGNALPIIARTRVVDRKISLLTERERRILELVGRDVDTKTIARMLRLSRSAVDSYRARAKAKLGIRTAGGLAIFSACHFHS